jgi:hypothetical protein
MRGQISVFIAVGVIILVAFGLLILFREKEVIIEAPATVGNSIQVFVEQCLAETSQNGILYIAAQGGHYEMPKRSIGTVYGDIPYYYYLNASSFYQKDESSVILPYEMAKQLDMYIEAEIGRCLDFSIFEGYSITAGEPSSYSRLEPGKVNVELSMQLDVSTDGSANRLSTFKAQVPARLTDYFTISSYIVTDTISDPYFINYPLIFHLMDKYNVSINTMSYEDDVLMYMIQDDNIVFDGYPMIFMFAVHVDEVNHAPELFIEDSMKAIAGEQFYYRVKATDLERQHLYFDSDLPINMHTGEITYTPFEKGEFSFNVTVSDGMATTGKTVRMVVE